MTSSQSRIASDELRFSDAADGGFEGILSQIKAGSIAGDSCTFVDGRMNGEGVGFAPENLGRICEAGGGHAVAHRVTKGIRYIVLAVADDARIEFALSDVSWRPGQKSMKRVPANVAMVAGWRFYPNGVDMPPEQGMPFLVTWEWFWAKLRGIYREMPKIGVRMSAFEGSTPSSTCPLTSITARCAAQSVVGPSRLSSGDSSSFFGHPAGHVVSFARVPSSAAQPPSMHRFRVDRYTGLDDTDMDESRSVSSNAYIGLSPDNGQYEDVIMEGDSQYAISSSGLSDGERTPTQNRQRYTESVASEMEIDVVESGEHEQQAGSEENGGSVHLGVGETGREGAQGAPSFDNGGVKRNKGSEDESIQPSGSKATRPATTVRGTAAASTSAGTPLSACTRAASVLDKRRRDPEVIDDGERFERDVTSLEISSAAYSSVVESSSAAASTSATAASTTTAPVTDAIPAAASTSTASVTDAIPAAAPPAPAVPPAPLSFVASLQAAGETLWCDEEVDKDVLEGLEEVIVGELESATYAIFAALPETVGWCVAEEDEQRLADTRALVPLVIVDSWLIDSQKQGRMLPFADYML